MEREIDNKLVWEQRWHPFRGEWVLYTSHRGGRPWIGDTVKAPEARPPSYDPTCALCPGNARLKGENPAYTGAYWFTNDLPCFGEADANVSGASGGDDLYQSRPALGTAEVVCYHPDHGKTFAHLSATEAAGVVELWKSRFQALAARPEVESVLIFENKGSAVGTSNPHPHCQIYAGNLVYGTFERESRIAATHLERTGRHLGMDVLERELAGDAPRVICQNAHFLACVPWFARYAYEVFILPKRPLASLADLRGPAEIAALGAIMREVAIRYDNLWEMPMPYVMALHQAPTGGEAPAVGYPFHIEYHPPLRKPDTLKYLAGPEIGGGSMTNESNPDEKAAELRAVSDVHYELANS